MYNVSINDELVAMGLSKGELNQHLLEMERETEDYLVQNLRRSLGFRGNGSLEDYLYSSKLKTPITMDLDGVIVKIY